MRGHLPHLKIQSVKFHRNGSAGEGFHCVRFLWIVGKRIRRCLATLFTHDERPTVQYAVVDLDDPEFRFDGYYFLEALENAVNAASDHEVFSWPVDTVPVAARV